MVAINSQPASRIAAVSVAVTMITGAFIDPNRGAYRRALSFENADGSENSVGRQAGIGIAMPTLIVNTVSVTIRQSDSEPIASVAATASFNRVEATRVERPSKPLRGATGSWSSSF